MVSRRVFDQCGLTCDKKIELPVSTEGVLFLKGWKIELPATLGL